MNIELQHITKRFRDKEVFHNLSMTFCESQSNCLMGPSGSGKTTIINMLMKLVKPDCGVIEGLDGRRIAAVFQEDRLIEHWNAVKNVRLVCSRMVTDEIICSEFQKVSLSEDIKKPVRQYSGGMKRRVAIVRAMLADSDLIIMDEPFKGLDSELKTQVIEYVKKRVAGKTVIIVTHDIQEAQQLEAHLITIKG